MRLFLLLSALVCSVAGGRQFEENFADDNDPSQAGFAADIFIHQFAPPQGSSTFNWFFFTGPDGEHYLFLASATDTVGFQLLTGEVVDQVAVEIRDYGGNTSVEIQGANDLLSIPVLLGAPRQLQVLSSDPGDGGHPLGDIRAVKLTSFEAEISYIRIDTRFTIGSDLALTQSVVATPREGLRSQVTWRVTAAGPQAATQVMVNGTIPAQFTYVPTDSDGRCSASGQLLTCNLGDIPAGGDANVQLTFSVADGSEGETVQVGGQVSAASFDYDPSNDQTSDSLEIGPPAQADLELSTMVVSPEAITPQGFVRFSGTVLNHGPDTAQNVVFSVDMPAGTILDQNTSSAGCTSLVSGAVECVIGPMVNGEVASPVVSVQVPSTPLSCNPATGQVSTSSPDPEPGNNHRVRGFTADDGSSYHFEILAADSDLAGLLGIANISIQDIVVLSDHSVALIANDGATPQMATRSWVMHWVAGSWQVLMDSADYPNDGGGAMRFIGLKYDHIDRLYVMSSEVGSQPQTTRALQLLVRDGSASDPNASVQRLFHYLDDMQGNCDACLQDWDVAGSGHVAFSLQTAFGFGSDAYRIFYTDTLWSAPVRINIANNQISDSHQVAINSEGTALVLLGLSSGQLLRSFVVASNGIVLDEGPVEGPVWDDVFLTDDMRVLIQREIDGNHHLISRALAFNGRLGRNSTRAIISSERTLEAPSRVLLNNAVFLSRRSSAPREPVLRVESISGNREVYRYPRCLFGQQVNDASFYAGGARDSLVTAWESEMTSGERWIMRAVPKDFDGDGVADYEERSALNDINNDQIEDYRQAEVVGTFSRLDGVPYFVSFAVPAPARFRNFRKLGEPPNGGSLIGLHHPWQYFGFQIEGLVPGASTIVDAVFSPATRVSGYSKYTPSPGDPQARWIDFNFDGDTGFERDLTSASDFRLHFRDGARGDVDQMANGVIVDPGAIAVPGPLFADGMEGLFGPNGLTILVP